MAETKTKEKVTPIEAKEEPKKWCPLAEDLLCDEGCAWWVTDSGKEECAIVKLAKGWQM